MTSLSAVDVCGVGVEIANESKVAGRGMFSRKEKHNIQLQMLEPGRDTKSCLVCCSAPACCPACSFCPCCDDAEYVKNKREASKYIFIRENSLEWNDPEIVVMQSGSCLDPCLYTIKDRVHTVYFDDVMFERITDQTRFCNECRTCLFGGRGERIRLDATCCYGLCLRSSFPCPFVPFCCPSVVFPCAWRHEIYVTDASKALYEIKGAIKSAKKSGLYI